LHQAGFAGGQAIFKFTDSLSKEKYHNHIFEKGSTFLWITNVKKIDKYEQNKSRTQNFPIFILSCLKRKEATI